MALPVTFEPNKQLIRELLSTQIDSTTLGTGFVQEVHQRFETYRDKINAERTEGPHPVEWLRDKPAPQP